MGVEFSDVDFGPAVVVGLEDVDCCSCGEEGEEEGGGTHDCFDKRYEMGHR